MVEKRVETVGGVGQWRGVDDVGLLVGQGHALQLLATVEHLVGETCDVGVHASLTSQDAHKLRATQCHLAAVKPLEERVAAVGEMDGCEQRVDGLRECGRLLHHCRQLLVVAHHDKLVDMGEQPHQRRLEYLAGLVDDGQGEAAQREEGRAALQRGGGSHDHAGREQRLAHEVESGSLAHAPVEQLVAEAGVAGVLVAYAQIVYARLGEHGADFVYRPVGVRGEQQRCVGVAECLFDHEAQRHRCLAGPRRAHEQEEVVGLLDLEQRGVVGGAVGAGELPRGVGCGFALRQQQLPAVARRVYQFAQTAQIGGKGIVGTAVLYGIGAVGEYMFVLLAVVEVYGDAVLAHRHYRTLEEDGAGGVGRVGVGIEIYRVARAEVGQEVLALVGHVEADDIPSAASLALLLAGDGEPGVDVAHLALGGERHIPQVGHAGTYALIAAHLGSQLLAHHECRHSAEVGVLYGAHGVERREQALELGQNVVGEEAGRQLSLVDGLGGELVDDAAEPVVGYGVVLRHDAVAQGNSLAEEGLVLVDGYQSAGQGILGVEQAYVGLAAAQPEVLAQQPCIEQQLHIVVLLLVGAILVGISALDIVVAARLLFDQQPHIGGHEVDTPLDAQPLADEGRLEDGPVAPVVTAARGRVGGEEIVYDAAQIVDLCLGVDLECGSAGKVGAGAVVERPLAEVGAQGVEPVVVLGVVDDVVEGAPGKVTQEYGIGVGGRAEPVGDIGERMVAVVGEAARYLADVEQIVGLDDDEPGLEVLALMAVDEVELHAALEQGLQIAVGGVVDDVGVARAVAVGMDMDELVVMVGDHAAQIAAVYGVAEVGGTPHDGQTAYEGRGHIGGGDCRHEQSQRAQVVGPVGVGDGVGAVGVAAHGLYLLPVGGAHGTAATQVVDLRKQVAKDHARVFDSLMAHLRQGGVQTPVAHLDGIAVEVCKCLYTPVE